MKGEDRQGIVYVLGTCVSPSVMIIKKTISSFIVPTIHWIITTESGFIANIGNTIKGLMCLTLLKVLGLDTQSVGTTEDFYTSTTSANAVHPIAVGRL